MELVSNNVLEHLQIIWNYHLLQMPVRSADCILVLGSNDLRVAEYAAELYFKGYVNKIIFSGAQGRLTTGQFKQTEAETFAEIAIAKGVPKDCIFLEKEATNTGENLQFTRSLIEKHNLVIKSAILVQKPYMERRTYATAKKQWPELEFTVSSPKINLKEFLSGSNDAEEVIHAMMGDLQRMDVYAQKGFQIPQVIPEEVWGSFNCLCRMGYTKHLIN
ncbi:YdcF family protein [Lentisphaera marina]|uniref:YdcF family protein n=1 Tax=Lentisphaera marina TaxID=1111041 RepID=UPI002366CF12|nr:YdcF family protein [Lentisphaera marina]MDD7986599.1 YdcF family protein [Lentisphaera marina]